MFYDRYRKNMRYLFSKFGCIHTVLVSLGCFVVVVVSSPSRVMVVVLSLVVTVEVVVISLGVSYKIIKFKHSKILNKILSV